MFINDKNIHKFLKHSYCNICNYCCFSSKIYHIIPRITSHFQNLWCIYILENHVKAMFDSVDSFLTYIKSCCKSAESMKWGQENNRLARESTHRFLFHFNEDENCGKVSFCFCISSCDFRVLMYNL